MGLSKANLLCLENTESNLLIIKLSTSDDLLRL